MESVCHVNGKFCLHFLTCGSGSAIFNACDFVKLISKRTIN